jgi:hypothetical protein
LPEIEDGYPAGPRYRAAGRNHSHGGPEMNAKQHMHAASA